MRQAAYEPFLVGHVLAEVVAVHPPRRRRDECRSLLLPQRLRQLLDLLNAAKVRLLRARLRPPPTDVAVVFRSPLRVGLVAWDRREQRAARDSREAREASDWFVNWLATSVDSIVNQESATPSPPRKDAIR